MAFVTGKGITRNELQYIVVYFYDYTPNSIFPFTDPENLW